MMSRLDRALSRRRERRRQYRACERALGLRPAWTWGDVVFLAAIVVAFAAGVVLTLASL